MSDSAVLTPPIDTIATAHQPGLHVCHAVLSLDVGGLERIVIDLIDAGHRLGQRVSVLCLERPGTLADEAIRLGARVVCLHKPAGLQWRTMRDARQALADLAPDVLHTHQIAALFYTGRAARRAGVPAIVHTEHGKHYAQRLRTRLLGRWSAATADRFCCVSGDIAAEVIACRVAEQRRVCVVPNGIDLALFAATTDRNTLRRRLLQLPEGAFIVGSVGRLTEIKRYDLLIAGFASLRRSLPAAQLVLVGDGPERKRLTAQVAALGLSDVVHFVGYQAEPQRWLPAFDVFALTSRSEGMPLSILEAWASRVPVVASRVGGLPELIDTPRTGLLVPFADVPALTAALLSLARDEALADEMRRHAYEHVTARFSLQQMAERYTQIYREVLAMNPAKVTCAS